MQTEREFRPSSPCPALHLSTLRASPVDTGRGTVSCWLRNRHTACPLDTASPRKDRWTLGTVLLWQRGTRMISRKAITLHSRKSRKHRNGSRAGLYRLWAERQNGRPEAGMPAWASAGVGAHQTSLHLPKAHCQSEVRWGQRVNGAPLFRLKYAKVVTGPTSGEERSYHMGSRSLYWMGLLHTGGHLNASLEFRLLLCSLPGALNILGRLHKTSAVVFRLREKRLF